MFRHPKSSIEASNIFLQPFVTSVWICTVVLGLVFTILLKQIFLIENHRHDTDDNEGSLSNSFLIIFGILFQQGRGILFVLEVFQMRLCSQVTQLHQCSHQLE